MTNPPTDGHDETSFEQQLDDLEAVLSELESGDLSLDEMLSRYERGMELVASCQRQLTEAELRVTKVAAETAGLDS